MSIGYGGTVSVSQVNSDLGLLAVAFHAWCNDMQQFDKRLTSLGHDGLVGLGFSGTVGLTDGEAQDVLDADTAMVLFAEAYFGTVTIPSMHNYSLDLEPLRGFRQR